MRIAVAGGTGRLGRLVVATATGAGHDVVSMSRTSGVDLITGAGLDEALGGVQAVVDVSNIETLSGSKSTEFFETATRNLTAAEQRAGVAHHVVVSIVGVDRVGLGYYRAKLRQEQMALAGPVPATVLRATQFYEFAPQMIGRGVGPFVITPRSMNQPVAAREVAEELVRLAAGAPQGLVADMAGPQRRPMDELIRAVVRARHQRRVVVVLALPGAVGRAMRDGGLCPTGEATLGQVTFEEWLASPDATQ
jgi:uncharacterized protein YbjT (DUF2867 family)